MNEFTPDEVAKIVDGYLHQHRQLDDIGARVLRGTAQRESCWYVPVGTAKEPSRKFEFYDNLSEVEDQVKHDQNIDVLIVPSGTVDSQ